MAPGAGMDAPFATKFVIVSDPEALEPERVNVMFMASIAAVFSPNPPKSARENVMEPDAPVIVFSTGPFTASKKLILHLRIPSKFEAKLKVIEVKFVKFGYKPFV
jgi:F420-dependent methylenetetrahydromethanopterin dehydrogenase